jgi:hypothetical protein
MKYVVELKRILATLLKSLRADTQPRVPDKLATEKWKYQEATQVTAEQALRLWDPDMDE